MRSSLELLLLSFVQQGLRTPYELKARAGISLGSTVPALSRLESDGLLRASDAGSRGSRTFEVTAAGAKTLKSEALKINPGSPSDTDNVLRHAYLAATIGSKSHAVTLLKSAASATRAAAKFAAAEAELFETSSALRNTEMYRWFRSRVEAARLDAEASAINLLANELSKRSQRDAAAGSRKIRGRKPRK